MPESQSHVPRILHYNLKNNYTNEARNITSPSQTVSFHCLREDTVVTFTVFAVNAVGCSDSSSTTISIPKQINTSGKLTVIVLLT